MAAIHPLMCGRPWNQMTSPNQPAESQEGRCRLSNLGGLERKRSLSCTGDVNCGHERSYQGAGRGLAGWDGQYFEEGAASSVGRC